MFQIYEYGGFDFGDFIVCNFQIYLLKSCPQKKSEVIYDLLTKWETKRSQKKIYGNMYNNPKNKNFFLQATGTQLCCYEFIDWVQ